MNIPKFKGALAERGVTQECVAHIIGVNPSTFYRKLASGGEKFTVGEIQRMVKKIPLTEEEAINIFLR